MNEVLLVDLSNLMYKYLYVYKTLSVPAKRNGISYKKPTGHLYGVPNYINSIRKTNPDLEIIIVVDGKSPRRGISEDYKANRKEYDEYFSVGRAENGRYNVHNDVPILLKLLGGIKNVRVLKDHNMEADDLIFSYVKDNKESKERIYILSEDRDLLINVCENVLLMNKIDLNTTIDALEEHTYWNIDSVLSNYYGCIGWRFINLKALIGDIGDNIKGYYRIPKKVAAYIAQTHRFVKTDNITGKRAPYKIGYSGSIEEYNLIKLPNSEEHTEFGIRDNHIEKWFGVMEEENYETFKHNLTLVNPIYKEHTVENINCTKDECRDIAKMYKLKTYIQNVINGDLYE